MKPLNLYQVDAFSSGVFTGNPAAICPLTHWLEDALLQAIAAENNLSETAFFVPITTKAESEDFYSRCFYPRHQVMEDPVTGSAHCVLTPFWSSQFGKQHLRARQGLERQGIIDCSLDGDRVLLTGECSLYFEGMIFV